MANYERGVYEPGNEVRVFDASEDEEDVEGSRLPLLIVLALVVLAMFAGVVYLAYTQGVAKGRGETPILTAANGPARIAPQQPGGATVPYQGFKIYEQPAPPDDAAENTAPAGAPALVQPPPTQTAEAQTPAATQTPPPAAAKPTPIAVPPPVRMVSKPPVKAPVEMASKPVAMASTRTLPAAKPVPDLPVVAQGPATAAPRQLGVPTPLAVASKPAPVKQAAASGSYVLQIGAYKSQAEAEAAWKVYKAKHASLLSGYGPDIQTADLGEKGTWSRLRIGGLADREGALALCERLKADGGGCFLGK